MQRTWSGPLLPLPPRLNDPARRRNRFPPLAAALALIGSIVMTRFAAQWHLPLPQCWLRKLTGLPCPSCGCTRSLLAWSHLDLAQAFFFNPLFFLLCLGLIVWSIVRTVERVFGHPRLLRWSLTWKRRLVWPIAILLAALNWLYLCLTLPK
jgi:hypothetical protein